MFPIDFTSRRDTKHIANCYANHFPAAAWFWKLRGFTRSGDLSHHALIGAMGSPLHKVFCHVAPFLTVFRKSGKKRPLPLMEHGLVISGMKTLADIGLCGCV